MASDLPPSSSAPGVTIAVELYVPRVAAADVSLQNQIGHALREQLAGVLALLGIPGQPHVAIASHEDPAADRPLRVFIDGRECGYPNELLRSVYAYTLGAHVDATMPVESMLEAFTDPSEVPGAASGNQVVQFVARACVEIVLAHPSAPLGPAQVASYLASLPRSEDGPPRAWDLLWAATALRAVIDQGLSLADRQKVAALLEETAGTSAADAAEHLISALAPAAIEIQLPSEYLREVTTGHAHDPSSLFPFLRDGLFVELGVVYPAFRFVVRDDMAPRTLAFRIGAIATLPIPGLAPDQLLVNDTAERMRRMEFSALPASNPATGAPACLIEADRRAEARSAGLTTWDNAEHLILSLAAALRRQSSTFVHRRSVQPHLDVLAHLAPGLIKHVTKRYRVEQISAVLRGLVAEEVSIRNLRVILESLLEAAEAVRGQAPSDSADHMPVADLVAHARRSLCYEIKNQCARGTDTVVVYLLDPALERMFDGERSPEGEEDVAPDGMSHAALRKAIETELGTLPKTAQLPALLAAEGARARLRRATAPAFPRLRVIAYEELPPDTNVQPVARIAVAAAAG